jgi:hypothetical protein
VKFLSIVFGCAALSPFAVIVTALFVSLLRDPKARGWFLGALGFAALTVTGVLALRYGLT